MRSAKIFSPTIWFISIVTSIGLALLLQSCDFGRTQRPPDLNNPRNVWMVIDDDSAATRDTLIRVYSGGENVQIMQIGADSLLSDTEWEEFAAIKIVNAPRLEGMFNVYGRFATVGGGTTATFHDDIMLDLTAAIDTLIVFSDSDSDTVVPGDQVEFYVNAGESGTAYIDFGSFIVRQELDWIENGEFRGSITIPDGVRDSAAVVVARFTDSVGNEADSIVCSKIFTVLGSSLNPRLLTVVEIPGARCIDVFLRTGFCYVTDWNGFIHIVNATIPAAAVLVGNSLEMTDWISGLDGKGTLLYVAYGSIGLAVVDISQPVSPHRASIILVQGQPRDVEIEDDYLFVSCYLSGLKVFDLQSEVTPREVANVLLTNYGEHIRFSEDIVYIGGGWGGSIIDVTNPRLPAVLKEYQVNGNPLSMVFDSGYMFFGTDELGLLVYDVREPTQPALVARYREYQKIHALEVSFPFMFAGGEGTFQVLNVADPTDITEIANVNGLGEIRGMYFDGRYVYLAEQDGVAIVDLFP